MQIGGLQKLTLIDYPGKIACTVFLAGCGFRCHYCYNPELVLPEKIKEQPKISEKNFFSFLKERQGLLEACVLGGGEPTIFQNLPDFIKKIKKLGFLIKLDTNGSNPGMIEELINEKLVDYIALDVKAPPEKYAKVIGLENQMFPDGVRFNFWTEKIVENIKKSIGFLKEGKVDYEFRTTIIPTLLEKKDILKIARWISGSIRLRQGFGGQGKYFLQNFRPEKTIDPEFEKIKPYPREYLLEIQKAIAPFFDVCQIRG